MNPTTSTTGLFLCRRSRTVLMADIADDLKKQGTINSACAYYVGDPSQHATTLSRFDDIYNDIDVFSPDISSLSDERIRQLEVCYDDSNFLWNTFYAERALVQIEQDLNSPPRNYKHSDAYALIIKALHYADFTISNARSAFIFDISALGLQRLAFQAAAKFYSIPFFLLGHSRIGERYTIYDDLFYTHNQITKSYYQLTIRNCICQTNQDGQEVIKSIQNNEPIYLGHAGALPSSPSLEGSKTIPRNSFFNIRAKTPRFVTSTLSSAIGKAATERNYTKRGLINYVDDRARAEDMIKNLLKSRYRSYKNRQTINNKLHDELPENQNKIKILFTWHVQPEQSTSQLAPFHVNQDIAVSNIARVAPLNSIVIVKPHPSTLGKVRPNVLQLLSRLPNVYFALPERPTAEIIPHCSAVVTLTGTSGLEGLAFGKPTFYFGMPSWRICNGATHCQTFEDLGRHLRNLKNHQPDSHDLANYFQAIVDNSVHIPEGKPIIREPHNHKGKQSYKAAIKLISSQITSKLQIKNAIEH